MLQAKKKVKELALLDFYLLLQEDDFAYFYNGDFNETLTKTFNKGAEKYIENVSETKKLQKRAIAKIFLESLRKALLSERLEKSYEIIRNTGFGFRNIGNITHAYFYFETSVESETLWQDFLKQIQRESIANIQSTYLELFSRQVLTENEKALLNFLDLPQQNFPELIYSIKQTQETTRIVVSTIHPNREGLAEEQEKIRTILQATFDLFPWLQENFFPLIYKGNFSKKSIAPILDTIELDYEKNQEKEGLLLLSLSLLIEMIRNISKHAKVDEVKTGYKEAFLILRSDHEASSIIAGNFLEKEQKEHIELTINYLNAKSKQELAIFYQNLSDQQQDDESERPKLGLLRIAGHAQGALQVGFQRRDQSEMIALEAFLEGMPPEAEVSV